MNFIDNIEIKNFKSIRHQKIEGCKRVNVFIGYPNVGKSNILEALGLYSIAGINYDLSKFVRFENSTSFFFNGNISEKAEIKINSDNRVKLSYLNDGVKFNRQFDKKKHGFDEIDKPQKFGNWDEENNKYANEVFSFGISHKDKKILSFDGSGFSYGEDALAPIYNYQFEKNIKYTSGSSPHLSYPLGENIFDIISSNEVLRKEIIEIFKDYELKFSFDKSTREFKILKDVGDDIFLISYSMIADTLHRLIFYKTAIQNNKESILLFEEPESHMFPPYISKFTGDMVNDENKNQFFLTTHSPFVLNDLIANVDKDELAIYIVSYKKETGESLIHKMSEPDVQEAYQFGYDFFMNINQFIPEEAHG